MMNICEDSIPAEDNREWRESCLSQRLKIITVVDVFMKPWLNSYDYDTLSSGKHCCKFSLFVLVGLPMDDYYFHWHKHLWFPWKHSGNQIQHIHDTFFLGSFFKQLMGEQCSYPYSPCVAIHCSWYNSLLLLFVFTCFQGVSGFTSVSPTVEIDMCARY